MKTTRVLLNIMSILLFLGVFSIGYAQAIDTAKLDSLFDLLLEKNKAMGSIALAKDGEILYTRSFGFSQISDSLKKPHTLDTKYRISSITKMYTAVMIFQLNEEGKLKLSDHLDEFFPQIPNAEKITIANMLEHRSGIPDLTMKDGWGAELRTHEEVLAVIANGKPIFEPDTRHLYSNTGYVILGYIVEKIDGIPYQEALEQRISSKIGLENTYLSVGNTAPENDESLAYTYFGQWKEIPEINLSIPAGAGAIMSTPIDMVKFIRALFNLKLVSKNSLDRMIAIRDGEGMGMELFSFAGRTLYGHTGGSNVSGAWLAYEPKEKLAMAYTTNAKIFKVSDIVAGVFNIYWNRPYEIPTFETLVVRPEILDQYVGEYGRTETETKMRIIRTGHTIAIGNGANSIPLEATATDQFSIAPGVTVRFDVAKKHMIIKRPQGEAVFTRTN